LATLKSPHKLLALPQAHTPQFLVPLLPLPLPLPLPLLPPRLSLTLLLLKPF
jgi:hypothetical protein